MAELEYGNRDNLFNMMKAHGPDGRLLSMTNTLMETNDLVRDLPASPANGNMHHQGVRLESIPTPTVTVVGGGWSASYARMQPYTEDLCIFKSRYQVPLDALALEANPAKYRREQERVHEEGMSQGFANTIIRGDASTAPEKINGLQNRAPWNALANTEYVFNMGGSSNLRSAWLMRPGLTTVHLLYPKTHPTKGVKREEMPKQLVTVTDTDANGSGKRWDAITEFEWWTGLCVRDQRAVKRICNINNTASAVSTNLIRNIVRARLRHNMPGPWFLYCDWSIYAQLVDLAGDKHNVRYSSDNPYRVSLPMIGDIMIRRMDALNTDESAVA